MAVDNTEVARRWLGAISSAHAQALAVELCDPDVDYYPVRKFPGARPCHGRDELTRFLAQWWEGFAVVETAIRELFPVGDNRVLALTRLRAEGRESGVRLEGDVHHCFWLRHGLILRMEDHLTVVGALHALGLSGNTLEAAGLRDSD